jgi:hypothetical protein
MQKYLIKSINFVLLVLIFIGLPAIARAQFGDVQIVAAAKAQMMMFWALIIAVAGNVIAALTIKGRKEKLLCWECAGAFVALFGVHFAFTHGYLNFNWLKQALLWLQKRF